MTIKCTQCGADVEVQQDETFIDCPYCASALFLDKRKVVFHYVIASNFKPNEAEGNLTGFTGRTGLAVKRAFPPSCNPVRAVDPVIFPVCPLRVLCVFVSLC